MTTYLLRKMLKNKWLMLCLILGNVILVGVVSAVPMFTDATMQRMMQEDLRAAQERTENFPATMILQYHFHLTALPVEEREAVYFNTRDVLWPEIVNEMNVPSLMEVQTYLITALRMTPDQPRQESEPVRSISLLAPVGFEENIRLTHGRMPAEYLVDGNIVEVLAVEWLLQNQDILLGELMHVTGNFNLGGGTHGAMYLRVVGVFETAEGSGAYWSAVQTFLGNVLVVSPGLVQSHFIPNYSHIMRLSANWTNVLDSDAMRASNVEHYMDTVHRTLDAVRDMGGAWAFIVNFYETIRRHTLGADELGITIMVLQAPIYVMLVLFMYMVTKQILLTDKNDISVLISRGASRFQILGIYAYQGLFVAAVSLPLGLGLGMGLCQIIGASSGFLDMSYRAALDIVVTGTAILYSLAALGLSFLYTLLPVVNMSKVTIVEHKQKKSRRTDKPIWQRYFLDVLLFGLSIYVLYNFNIQREVMMATLPDTRAFDPLIFLSSSLFVIGAGLVCLRLYPYIVKLILLVGGKRFKPSVYASMLNITRASADVQFIMLFLVFTVAMGMVGAQTARTINLNNAHRVKYLSGADLIFSEPWENNIPIFPDGFPPPLALMPSVVVYTEPDITRFTHLPEIESYTPVMLRDIGVQRLRGGMSRVSDMTMMAIDTQSFGETVWFRDDLLMVHINYYLNALALQPNGVLLSSNFYHDLRYQVGDYIRITENIMYPWVSRQFRGDFVVVGFVDYWPGFTPLTRTLLTTGEVRTQSNNLAITNLGHIQTIWGVRPYQVWLSTHNGGTQFFTDFVREEGIRVSVVNNTSRNLAQVQTEPIVQSTNGILTIGFILTLLLCFAGFLIYWILSIKGRLLQFGLFRAMGMGTRGIMGILVSEQVLVTVSSLLIGGVLGIVTAQLFVPLIQLSYTAADLVIPLILSVEPTDFIALYSILALMVVLCIGALAVYTSRVNVSQILKLGED